jgi:hypothetical protein
LSGDSADELADQPASLSVEDPAHDPRTDRADQGPPGFDTELYKEWRGIATRYDEHATIGLNHRIRI